MGDIEKIPPRYRNRIKIDPETDCWLWTGAKTSKGRGCVRLDGRTITVHRLFFELFVGPVPDGLELHHTCRTLHCCNYDHLVPTTRLEHKQHHPVPIPMFCKRGHPYTEENTRKSKLGWHSCRICFNEAQLRRYHAKKHG